MIILDIFIIILCVLLLLILSVLLIPFGYSARAVSHDEKSVRFNVCWLFGLLGFTGQYIISQGFEGRMVIFGFTKKFEKKVKTKKEKKEKKKKKKHKKRRTLRDFNIREAGYLFKNLKKALRHLLPDRIRGYARLGFDDPYDTAVFCYVMETLRSMRLHRMDLEYVFEDEVYEGELDIRGRIFIIYFVYIAARLYLNKTTKRLVFY